MATHRFQPTRYYNAFGTYESVLRIASGDTVETTCADAGGSDEQGRKVAQRPNPLTGPFYVEDAEPGDTLAVQIDHAYPNRDLGYTRTVLAENVVDPAYVRELPGRDRMVDWRLDLRAGTGTLIAPGLVLDGFVAPLAPMLGCLGVAPKDGQALASATSAEHGGNMDYRMIGAGATLYFPVFAPGALLFVGDGHAVQGDGEINGTGIEVSFDVRLTVRLIKGQAINWPHGEDEQTIFTIGNARPLEQALQHATTEMMRWLQTGYGLDPVSASILLGECVEYNVGNVYDPAFTMVCRLRKSWLVGRG